MLRACADESDDTCGRDCVAAGESVPCGGVDRCQVWCDRPPNTQHALIGKDLSREILGAPQIDAHWSPFGAKLFDLRCFERVENAPPVDRHNPHAALSKELFTLHKSKDSCSADEILEESMTRFRNAEQSAHSSHTTDEMGNARLPNELPYITTLEHDANFAFYDTPNEETIAALIEGDDCNTGSIDANRIAAVTCEGLHAADQRNQLKHLLKTTSASGTVYPLYVNTHDRCGTCNSLFGAPLALLDKSFDDLSTCVHEAKSSNSTALDPLDEAATSPHSKQDNQRTHAVKAEDAAKDEGDAFDIAAYLQPRPVLPRQLQGGEARQKHVRRSSGRTGAGARGAAAVSDALRAAIGRARWDAAASPGTLRAAVVRISNISWDLASADVYAAMSSLAARGPGRVPFGLEHVHIPIDRETGKTRADMYVEVRTPVDALVLVAHHSGTVLRGRVLTLGVSSHEALHCAHFCDATLCGPEMEGACAVFGDADAERLVAVCRNYKAHFSRKCAERPFEHAASVLRLVPWMRVDAGGSAALFRAAHGAVDALVDHLRAGGCGRLCEGAFPGELLGRLRRAVRACPALDASQVAAVEALVQGYRAEERLVQRLSAGISPRGIVRSELRPDATPSD